MANRAMSSGTTKAALLLCCLAMALHATSAQVSGGPSGTKTFIDNGGSEICSNEIGPVSTLFVGNTTNPNNTLPNSVSIAGGSCSHFYRGVDITGVLNRFLFTTADGINNSCDCIRACMAHIGVCMNWAWKFTGVVTGDLTANRTCTLYSNFQMPPQVTVAYNLTGSMNAAGQLTTGIVDETPHNNNQFGHLRPFRVTQEGSKVPQCVTNDGNSLDPGCLSGIVLLYDNNTLVC